MIIDFETDGAGNALLAGAYVSGDWAEAYGLTVFANASGNGFTPDGKARIFDSSNPGTEEDGDPDLGTPNELCGQGGPGQGEGGREGASGQNCVARGNILIIQESNKTTPDDSLSGGSITFLFETPVQRSISLGLLDIEDNNTFIEVETEEASGPIRVDVVGEGNNAFQSVALDFSTVRRVTVHFSTSGAVTDFKFCSSSGDIRKSGMIDSASAASQTECTSEDFPCSAYPGMLQICFYNFTDSSWDNTCIEESEWENVRSVWSAYCGPCQSEALSPGIYMPKTKTEVKEISIDGGNCEAGKFGAENIEIIESNGHEVKFAMKHSFCPDMDKAQIWFSDPGHHSDSLCHQYSNVACDGEIGSYTARCSNGWADVNIIGEKGSDFGGQMVSVPTPRCQDDFDFVDFNPQKRCFWQMRLPCSTGEPESRKLLEATKTTETDRRSNVVQTNPLESDCESKSRAVDVLPVNVDRCMLSDFQPPVKLLSQDKDTVTFSISQVWKGCSTQSSDKTLSWVSADYIGLDDNLHCSKFDSLACGLTTTISAKCSDGASVVDIYTYDSDPSVFQQTDGSAVIVPSACGATGDATQMCHFRYILKCEPSQCIKSRPSVRRLGSTLKHT